MRSSHWFWCAFEKIVSESVSTIYIKSKQNHRFQLLHMQKIQFSLKPKGNRALKNKVFLALTFNGRCSHRKFSSNLLGFMVHILQSSAANQFIHAVFNSHIDTGCLLSIFKRPQRIVLYRN